MEPIYKRTIKYESFCFQPHFGGQLFPLSDDVTSNDGSRVPGVQYGQVDLIAIYRNKLVSPIFTVNNYINTALDKINIACLKPILGGLGIFYLIVHYMIYTLFL